MLSVIKSYVNHKAVLRKRGLSSIAVEGAYLYPKTAGPEPAHGEDVFAGYNEAFPCNVVHPINPTRNGYERRSWAPSSRTSCCHRSRSGIARMIPKVGRVVQPHAV